VPAPLSKPRSARPCFSWPMRIPVSMRSLDEARPATVTQASRA
jgi:hypothetical protein